MLSFLGKFLVALGSLFLLGNVLMVKPTWPGMGSLLILAGSALWSIGDDMRSHHQQAAALPTLSVGAKPAPPAPARQSEF